MELFDKKDVPILCPNCGKILCKADARDNHLKVIMCRRCWKLVYFRADDPRIRIVKEIPPRDSSGSKRFY